MLLRVVDGTWVPSLRLKTICSPTLKPKIGFFWCSRNPNNLSAGCFRGFSLQGQLGGNELRVCATSSVRSVSVHIGNMLRGIRGDSGRNRKCDPGPNSTHVRP